MVAHVPKTLPKPRVQLIVHLRVGDLLSQRVLILPAKKAA